MHAQNTVDLAHDLALDGVGLLLSCPNIASATAQQILQRVVHKLGIRRRFGFRHRILRHHTILLDERHEHVPLPAIADGIGEEVVDGAIVCIAIGQINHRGEEEVRLLQLVPKVHVVL